MPLSFRTINVQFSDSSGKTASGKAQFTGNVIEAEAAIKGFQANFTNTDHHTRISQVIVKNVVHNGEVVSFDVEFDFQDNSGHVEAGFVDVLVIAMTA